MSATAVPLHPIRKRSVLKLWIALGALSLGAGALAWVGTSQQVIKDPAAFLAANGAEEGIVTTASGLQYKVIQPGSGARPGPADVVAIEYEGRLIDGTVFDSTEGKGPATFPVMGVVPGFGEAVQLMQRGSKLRIWLPPQLAYGDQEQRDPQTDEVVVPANSVLEFDLTLLDFKALSAEELQQLQMMQALQQQMRQQGGQ